eukprot:GFUD01005935.1.p1 GENE.GFUD01005935.1~~GFUD01005935.1.p1  ORF type:complete len:314 (-),score=76.96 GFUD01005935.1:155-1051(-)
MASSDGAMWSFGYGSNMDVKALQAKKHVKVLDHTPAILPNFKLCFTIKAMTYSEPAYASVRKVEEEEVHGVAFMMDAESLEELDRTERGYDKAIVTLKAYDGRELEGFVYVPKEEKTVEFLPSKRYLGVLCKGARQAGLQEEYIAKLEALPTYNYQDHPEVLKAREERAKLVGSLKEITNEELWGHKNEDSWVSVLGFVIKQNSAFGSHKGRDITSRVLMQYHGIPMDDNDDGGAPPYPLVNSLTSGELEYVTSWLDHYHLGGIPGLMTQNPEILGFLKEFQVQQDSGETNFVLPPIP